MKKILTLLVFATSLSVHAVEIRSIKITGSPVDCRQLELLDGQIKVLKGSRYVELRESAIQEYLQVAQSEGASVEVDVQTPTILNINKGDREVYGQALRMIDAQISGFKPDKSGNYLLPYPGVASIQVSVSTLALCQDEMDWKDSARAIIKERVTTR